MTPALYEQATRAIQVITDDGRRLQAGRAMLFILEEVGWHPWLARLAARPAFVWAIEISYQIVARHRPLFSRFLFRGE
jgi:predicted DCC family thiol-disulfide oxidoreductase YuxK